MEGILFAVAFLPVLLLAAIRRGLFSATFLVSFHLFLGFGIRTLYLMTPAGGRDILAPWILASRELPVLEVALLIAMYSGLVIFGLLKGQVGANKNSDLLRLQATVGGFSRVLILACLALIAFLLLASQFFGGLESYARILATRSSEAVAGFGYAGILFDLSVVSVVSLYYLHLCTSPKRSRNWLMMVVVLGTAALLFVGGGRGNLIQYFLSLLIIRLSIVRGSIRKYVLLAVLPLLVGAVIIVGLSVRIAAQYNISYSEAQSRTMADVTSVILAPFALTDHLMISKKFVAVHGHDFGYQYLTNLVKPVPRSVWPDKPVPQPIQVRRTFWGDDFGGIPPGVFGEAYIAFGRVGIGLATLCLGLLALRLDRLQLAGLRDPSFLPVYSLLVPYVAFNLVRGGVDIAFTRIAIILASFLLVRLVVHKRVVIGSVQIGKVK